MKNLASFTDSDDSGEWLSLYFLGTTLHSAAFAG